MDSKLNHSDKTESVFAEVIKPKRILSDTFTDILAEHDVA